ncbi:MAG TPA: riboflavin synthase [Acidimicrobiales bacterium]|nr:riboflavin synthase [Acidimicrobiales bacterium]
MFTGIVEELAQVRSREKGRFTFYASAVLDGLRLGDSIAHNGCCLTVVEISSTWYAVDVVEETLARTNLGDLAEGDPVNLERPLKASDRLGGHLVQGHIDGVGHILSAGPALEVRIPPELTRYVVEKGSIAVDGVSLTVAKALPDGFTAAVVPHTAAVTTLGLKGPGDTVNIEVDLVAKYVERLLVGTTEP